MEAVTILIGLAGAAVAVAARPVWGLVAYLVILYLWPDYVRVSLGGASTSAARLVITALVLRCLADPRLRGRFRWILLDKLVLLVMTVFAGTLLLTTPLSDWFINRVGFLMDTLLVYGAVRLIVTSPVQLRTVVRALAILTVPLAIGGIVETFTARSLYSGLGQYCPWAPLKGMFYQERFGLNRAMGPQGETIMFGLSFAMLVPLVRLLRHERTGWKALSGPGSLAALLGVGSTISSGPYLATIVTIGCLALERAKWLVRPVLVMIVLACVAVEFLSNRHFYYVIGDFAMDGGTAWYRARLIDAAVANVSQYGLYGYGFGDPGWGAMIDGNKRTDGVNDYIVQAVVHGLFGLAVYAAMLIEGLRTVARVHRSSRRRWDRSCAWGLGSALIGLMFAFWSVSLFGQMVNMFYLLLGLIGSLGAMEARPIAGPAARKRRPGGNTRRPGPVRAGAAMESVS